MRKRRPNFVVAPEDDRIPVDGPEQIPDFATDEEELEFWRTHTFSERFWAEAKRMSPQEALRLPPTPPRQAKPARRSR